jgi:hypothetical protein
MSRSETEIARDAMEDARAALSCKLSDAVTPGIDLDALLDTLDDYIVARVNLMKLDY